VALRSPFKCPACTQDSSVLEPRCVHCQAFREPPADANYFEILGLVPSLALDPEILRERFYTLSRLTHPDRLASFPTAQGLVAARWSTAVNRAYQALRDPFARARYLLELHGLVADSGAQVPFELAETYFDLQDRLSEPGDHDALRDFAEGLRAQLSQLDSAWKLLENGWNPAEPKKSLEPVAKHLTLRRFLGSMLHDIEKRHAP